MRFLTKKYSLYYLLFTLPFILGACEGNPKNEGSAISMITSADQSSLLVHNDVALSANVLPNAPIITVNPDKQFQTMDGFGFTLTGGSALHMYSMEPSKREAMLKELFGHGKDAIGISYLRLSVGASDLDAAPFSYNDLPEGETDVELKHFSLDNDRDYLIPLLKEIMAINPEVKLMGSPWSPPKWMKDNNDTRGGSLMPKYYDAYARYLVKYIEGMEEEGLHIDALTVQNEPLHPGNNPSLLMLAADQAIFIKEHLGPAFEKAGLTTKIIIYDHNADRPDYPISILDDPEANKYVDGSAFHMYGGEIDALSEVHNAHPDKHLYFTEQWVGAPGDFPENLSWHTKELIIGASRNWSKTVLEWNLAADPNQEPHTDRGGCDRCLGAITVDNDEFVRNPAYYIIAHASKYVSPGSVRLDSDLPIGLPNVAFKTPEGKIVVIVLNDGSSEQSFTIAIDNQLIPAKLAVGSVGTFVWMT